MKRIFLISIILLLVQTVYAQKALLFKTGQQLEPIGNLKLKSGQTIDDCKIGYRVHGKLNKEKSNVVIYLTWFGGNSEGIEANSPWNSVDTTTYCLIIIDALGNGVSTSPSNSITQHGTRFPPITVSDMVESEHMLLYDKFKIKHVRAVIGVSMGGIQTFQWGISYPGYMDVLIPIVGSPQATGYDLMLYHTFLEILDKSPEFNKGNYTANPKIGELNMLWDLFLTTPGERVKSMPRTDINKWVEQQRNATHPDWNDTRLQMMAIIDHDISKSFNGSMAEAAAHIQAKMLIISSLQDHMVNPAAAINFSKLLPAKLIIINDEKGHMAPGGNPQAETGITAILKDTEIN
jgi:homoserine O-acetyltransferase